MPGFAVALAWMVLSPVAVITDIIGVVVCLHYKPSFHSCDVAFISIFITMATSSALLFPVPAIVILGNLSWNKHLCLFYVWLSIALRTSHLLVLLVLNVYWVASLRMSPKGRMFMSTKPMKAFVGACWIVSGLVGLPAVAGGSQLFPIFQDDVCNFLPANVHVGYAVFFIILSLVSVIMGFISTLDTLLVLGSMRAAATSRYRAAGIHAPTFSGGAGGGSQAHVKYNQLNVSIELCRLVLCFSMASAAMDALPLLVSQFMELTQKLDLEALEVAWLWLLLMESLTLPHILWALSIRYRHAVAYTWRVFVLRDQGAVEADASTCTLQAFRMQVKDADDMLRVRSLQKNGTRSRSSIPEVSSYMAGDREDQTSPTTNDISHDNVDEPNNVAAIDGCWTRSTQTRPSEIVVHGNWGQDSRNTSDQGHDTSVLPPSQGGTEGLSNVQSSVFAISDTHTDHVVAYENGHTVLTTFTYGLKKPVEMSTSRQQIQKSDKQNTPRNTVILLNSALNDTGKNTVPHRNNEYSRNGVPTIFDALDNACIRKSNLHNSCSCNHTSTQQNRCSCNHTSTQQNRCRCNHTSTQHNTVYDGSLDCLNNEFTNVLIQKIFLNKSTEGVCADTDKDNTSIAVWSNVNSQIIIPHWIRAGNLATRNQINNRSMFAHPAQERPAVCCDGISLPGRTEIDMVNQNIGDVQQKPYILVKKYTIILGVYYDDTHRAENSEQSELLVRTPSDVDLNISPERSNQPELVVT